MAGDPTRTRHGHPRERRADSLTARAQHAFTADVYATVAEELADAAASQLRHSCPARARSSPVVPAMCQLLTKMITDIHQGPAPLAQAPGQERRLGDLNPGWARTQTALAVRRHRPD